jgi:ligand-binding SRPBCC domain-containing protein
MSRLEIETVIHAPIERVFDLARDLDLHLRSMEATGETAIAGRTSGLIGLNEEVTWRARHFGIAHEHSSRITEFERPSHFRDTMIKGRFKHFEHDHYFEWKNGATIMRDVISFSSPLGILGRAVDSLALNRYLHSLIIQRNFAIKASAEGL